MELPTRPCSLNKFSKSTQQSTIPPCHPPYHYLQHHYHYHHQLPLSGSDWFFNFHSLYIIFNIFVFIITSLDSPLLQFSLSSSSIPSQLPASIPKFFKQQSTIGHISTISQTSITSSTNFSISTFSL